MEFSKDEFRSWCYRNGGETYGRAERPGIVYHFPDSDEQDHIGYLPDRNVFQVITDGQFFVTHSIHEQAEPEIDDDRLPIETAMGESSSILDEPVLGEHLDRFG